MKKKILSLFLISTIFCGMLVGCGSNSNFVNEDFTNSNKVNNEVNEEINLLPIPSEVVTRVEENIQENSSENIIEETIEDSSFDLIFEEFEEENSSVFGNEVIDKIDFSKLEEIEIIEGKYDNFISDFEDYFLNDKVLIETNFENDMSQKIGIVGDNLFFSMASDTIIFDLYKIDGKLYSYVESITTKDKSYNWAIDDSSNEDESLTDSLDSFEFKELDIIEADYYRALKDKDGTIYDVIKALIDDRDESEKNMLAYKTPNGIMYLSEGVSSTIDGVTYGGEDGIKPLEEVPLVEYTFYIQREDNKIVAFETIVDNTTFKTEFSHMENIVLPNEFENAIEVTTEEIAFQMLGTMMYGAMDKMTTDINF